MLFEGDGAQRLIDARQQLLVLPADKQVQIGGESAVERVQLQVSREVLPDHRVQRCFQADRSIGVAAFNSGQGRMAVGEMQEVDPGVVDRQPVGIGTAFNHGQQLRPHAGNVTGRVLAFTHSQYRLAAMEGAGGPQVGTGKRVMRGAAHDQHQVGLVPADGSDRCARAGVVEIAEAQAGMPSHKLGIAMGEGGQCA